MISHACTEFPLFRKPPLYPSELRGREDSICQKLPISATEPTASPQPGSANEGASTAPSAPQILPTRTGGGEPSVGASVGEDRSGLSAAALRAANLPARRLEALRWVELHPDSTGRELERASRLRKINARLSELERQGVVAASGVRTCSVTGEAATTWRATGEAPRPLVRPPSARERIEALKALADRLEAENAALRAKLAERQSAGGQLGLPEVAP